MFVSFQASIDMFRAKQMIQDKAQTADNGMSLLRAVTPYWVICFAPFGRAGKCSFAALRCGQGLVLLQGDIDVFRVIQMIQDKTQTANNGMSLLRAVTPYWIIWVAPFGRAGKRSSAVLRLWVRTSHYLRGAPGIQPLPDSLNMPISP